MKKIILFILCFFVYVNVSFGLDNTNETEFNQKVAQERSHSSQILIEKSIVSKLSSSLKIAENDNFIYEVINDKTKLYIVNDNFEYVEGDEIKKIIFTKYYKLDKYNYKIFSFSNGVIVNKYGTNDFMLVYDYKIDKKIPYSKISSYTKGYISEDTKYTLINGSYYSYVYKDSIYFPDEKYGLYLDDIKKINKGILYKGKNGRYSFITNYKLAKLVDSSLINNISSKHEFLKELAEDVTFPGFTFTTNDYNKDLEDLKNKTLKITTGLSDKKKIEVIYAYILNNISYSKKIDFKNKEIFSGIDTYKNKDGVCLGYTKLFLYMLSFAGIKDVQVVRGDVFDAPDFPNIGHAWVKIGNNYYDPTFDDPIGLDETRKFDEYRYFGLPKDLFYTNRYDLYKTPANLKSTSLSYRKTLVSKNISKLLERYKNNNYLILNPFVFREKLGLNYNEKITIDSIKNKIPFYKVKNLYIYKDNGSFQIKSLNYISINNDNIENILEQFNYDMNNIIFLEWDLGNGKIDYRLAINLKI